MGSRILAIDDSLTVRKMMEIVLGAEGYDVCTAKDGAEGYELLSTNPDLILLDYMLPDMRGSVFCEKLIRNPDTSSIPVLLVSGKGNEIKEVYQNFSNIVDYLSKPVAPNVLKAVVAQSLKQRGVSEKSEVSSKDESESPEKLPTPYFQIPAKLLGLLHIVSFLTEERSKGKLTITMDDEEVVVFYDSGEIDLIVSNNPEKYCKGASFDFAAAPREVISKAIAKQKNQLIPFYITLHKEGIIKDQDELKRCLRDAGRRTFLRASSDKRATIRFESFDVLPDMVRDNVVSESIINLLLLDCRTNHDSDTARAIKRNSRFPVKRHEHFDYYVDILDLKDEEQKVVELVDDFRSVKEISNSLNQSEENVSRILSPFKQLGIVRF
ncbi:MAG: response regulator [Verrucomicrobiota bacterium]